MQIIIFHTIIIIITIVIIIKVGIIVDIYHQNIIAVIVLIISIIWI